MPSLTETLRKTAPKLTVHSSLLRRARIWRNTRSGGATPPPAAFPAVLGLLPRLKAISTDHTSVLAYAGGRRAPGPAGAPLIGSAASLERIRASRSCHW